ncbi:MAG: sensor histidine kinase [Sandaracinaceae bacterium]
MRLRRLTRAQLAYGGSLAVTAAFLWLLEGIRGQLEGPLLPLILLASAVLLLGALLALRAFLQTPAARPGASLWAAVTPVVAGEVFLLPGLVTSGVYRADLVVLLSLLAVPSQALWSRWVFRVRAEPSAEAAVAGGAPLVAAGLLCTGALFEASPLAHVLAFLPGLAFAGLAFRWVGRHEADLAALAGYAEGIQLGRQGLHRPPAPPLGTARMRAFRAELDRSLEELLASLEAGEEERTRERDQAQRLRTRFMAAMSHELRSPLNSIVGFAQVLERGLDGDLSPGQTESVAMVRRSAEELLQVLTDVLDLARLEAGRLRLDRRWIPSVEILTEAVRRGRAIVHGRDVEIESVMQPGLPPVYADRQRICQAVVALFRSAALSLSGTRIRLRARVATGPPGPAEHVRVEIHDALGAIPKGEVDRIFDAFREIQQTGGRRLGGLGMALSLARALVRLHGGEVWANSVPGETVLCVALPLDGPTPSEVADVP